MSDAMISVVIAFLVLLVHPFARAQAALDIELAALAHETIHYIRKAAPQNDRMPFGMLSRFVGLTIEYPFGRRQTHPGDLHALSIARTSGSIPTLPTNITLLIMISIIT